MTAEHTKDVHQAPLIPPVPLTIDGSAILHQMFRIRWHAWKALPTAAQQSIVEEASSVLTQMEQVEQDAGNKSAIRIAMIVITTSNSTSVKPCWTRRVWIITASFAGAEH